jgi:glycosyltransferase involved in cell wall biosynthesis
MIRQKGIEEFVRAAELLRKRDCDVHMVLAGDADEGNPDAIRVQDLQRWAEEGLVEWRGKVEDIPDLWSMSHIAVLPSRGGEGVPKSLIEAASCGRPIVATDVPGCRDIVRDGQNGVLVPVGDAEKLADAIEALANDRESQHRMGHRGRELVLEHYSADVIAARTGELYRELTPALPASER